MSLCTNCKCKPCNTGCNQCTGCMVQSCNTCPTPPVTPLCKPIQVNGVDTSAYPGGINLVGGGGTASIVNGVYTYTLPVPIPPVVVFDDQVLMVSDTPSVNLTATPSAPTGTDSQVNYTLQADVKISATAGNAIVQNPDGIFVSAELDNQTLSVVAPTSIAISGGNTVNLSTLVKNAETDTTLDSVSLSNTGLVLTSEVKYTGEDGAQQTKTDTTDITADVQALVDTSITAITTTNSLTSSGLNITSTVNGVANSEDITTAVQALIDASTDSLVDNADGTYTHTAVGGTVETIDTRKNIIGEEVDSTAIVLGENETLLVKSNPNPAHTLPYTDAGTKTLFVPRARVAEFGTATTVYTFGLNKMPDATSSNPVNDLYSFNIPFTTTAPTVGNWKYIIKVWNTLGVVRPNHDFDIWSYTTGGVDTDQRTDGYSMGVSLYGINVSNEITGSATSGQVIIFTHSINHRVKSGIQPLMTTGQWDIGQGEVTVLWIPA